MKDDDVITALAEMQKEIKTLTSTFTAFCNMTILQNDIYEKRITRLEKIKIKNKIYNILNYFLEYSYLIFLSLLMILFCKFILHL